MMREMLFVGFVIVIFGAVGTAVAAGGPVDPAGLPRK